MEFATCGHLSLAPKNENRSLTVAALMAAALSLCMAAEKKPRRRWVRRTIIGAGVVVVLVILLAALLPVFVGWGLFQEKVRSAIAASFNGDVEMDGLSVSWFGDQSIDRVTIEGPEGYATAELHIRLERGLLPLVFGTTDYGTLALSGEIEGVRYEDGSTSLQTLLKDSGESKPLDMKVRILLEGIDITLDDETTGDTLAVRDVEGEVDFDSAGPIALDVEAATNAGGRDGSLQAKGSIEGLYDEAGLVDFANATFDLTADLEEFPVPVLDGLLHFNGKLAALTGDVVEQATLTFDGDLNEGAIALNVDATSVEMRANAHLRDGALQISSGDPVEVILSLTSAGFAALTGVGEQGVVSMAEGSSATVTARISNADIPLPLSDEVDYSGGTIEATLVSGDLPLRVESGETTDDVSLEVLRIALSSADITQAIQVTADGTAALSGGERSTLAGNLTIGTPISADGAVTIDPAKIEGEIEALQVPSALAQGFVGDGPVVLARDLGPRTDLIASFSSGESRAITLTMTAEHADAEARATVAPGGAIAGEFFALDIHLQPEFVEGLSPLAVSMPRQLRVQLTSFAVPAREEGTAFSLAQLAAEGTIGLSGEPIVATEVDARPIDIESLDLSFSSARLGESLIVNGSTMADGATIEVEETLSRMFDTVGSLQLVDANAVGTIAVRGINESHVAAMSADLATKLQPLLGEGADIVITTSSLHDDALIADIALTAAALEATAQVQRTPDAVRLEGAEMRLDMTPDLLRAWQPESENPIEAQAEDVTIVLTPSPLFRRDETGFHFALDHAPLQMKAANVLITRGPALAGPIALRRLAADIDAALVATGGTTIGGSFVARTAGEGEDRKIADAEFDVTLPPRESEDSPSLELALREISTVQLKNVLTEKAASAVGFLGETGAITAAITPTEEGFTAELTPEFPNVAGTFTAARTASSLSIQAEDARIVLSAAAMTDYANAVGGEETPDESAPAPPRITVARDVPLQVDIRSLVLPPGILTGEPLSSTAADVDIEIAIREPLMLERAIEGSRAESAQFETFTLKASGDDLETGISVALDGVLKGAANDAEAQAPEETQEGKAPTGRSASRSRIEVTATLSNLVNDGNMLETSAATINATARVRRTPSWVVDALAGTGTMINDLLGATVTAELVTENLSPTTGTLNANVSGGNESRLRARLIGRDDGYAAERGDPITGAITFSDDLRARLLHRIHPIFTDVKTIEEQVRFKVRQAFVPARSDLSQLDGIIELTVGAATFTPSSEFLSLLKFVQGASTDTIEGYIGPLDGSPIVIRIRNGRITYENFIVHLIRMESEGDGEGEGEGEDADAPLAYAHRVLFSGDVSLAEGVVTQIVGAYPVADLAGAFGAGLPDVANIAVRFSGDLYDDAGNPLDLARKIEVDISAESIFEEGLRRVPAEDAPGLQRILEGIFGGGD